MNIEEAITELRQRLGEADYLDYVPSIAIETVLNELERLLPKNDEMRTFRRNFRRPVNCTPADENTVIDWSKEWCRNVARITVLNQERASAMFARIRDGYNYYACIEAIREYGKDEWHRVHNQWLDIAQFFQPQKLESWIRRAEDRKKLAEKKIFVKQAANAGINSMVKEVAETTRVKSDDEILMDELRSKTPEEVDSLREQARAELKLLYPGRKIVSDFRVHQQVLEIMKREKK